jgi:hypothetical protein
MDWKSLQKRLHLLNWVILLILSAGALLMSTHLRGRVFGRPDCHYQLHVLQHTFAELCLTAMRKGKFSIIIKSYLRLFAQRDHLYSHRQDLVDPVGLAVGVSTILFSIVSLGIILAVKTKAGEAV